MENITHKTGTAHVTSTQFRDIIASIVGSGSYIVNRDELMEAELAANNTVKIRSGILVHHGDVVQVPAGTYDQVTYQNGTQGMKRIDLIVYRYTKAIGTDKETGEWVVIQGTPAESDPQVPAYTEGNMQDGDLVDDCPLFEIHLDGINATEVTKLLDVTMSIEELIQKTSYLNMKINLANSSLGAIKSGTWTPVVDGVKTVDAAVGNYIKIGSMVVIEFYVTGTFGGGVEDSSTYVNIGNLPFAPSAESAWYAGGGHWQGGLINLNTYPDAVFDGFVLQSSKGKIFPRLNYRSAADETSSWSTINGGYINSDSGEKMYASGTIMYKTTS